MITDPIADYLTCIRNAMKAKHINVEVKSSSIKKSLTETMHDQGYIKSYSFDDEKNYQGTITIELKYHPRTKVPAITKLIRRSKPGRRIYLRKDELLPVLNGLGIGILSTSQGIMTDKEAKRKGIGGEEICHIY